MPTERGNSFNTPSPWEVEKFKQLKVAVFLLFFSNDTHTSVSTFNEKQSTWECKDEKRDSKDDSAGGDNKRLVPDGKQVGVEALGQDQGTQGSQGTWKEHCTILAKRR